MICDMRQVTGDRSKYCVRFELYSALIFTFIGSKAGFRSVTMAVFIILFENPVKPSGLKRSDPVDQF